MNLIRAKQLNPDVSGLVTQYASGDFLPRIEAEDFVSNEDLAQTGEYIIGLIEGSNAGVNTINGISGFVNIVGLNGVEIAEESGSITISVPAEIGLALSDEDSALETGIGMATFRLPYDFEIEELRANVSVAPSGGDISIDIVVGDLSIFDGNLLTINGGEESSLESTPYDLDYFVFADDEKFRFDILDVPTGFAGAGLKVWMKGKRL
jgi:hypothetical protein